MKWKHVGGMPMRKKMGGRIVIGSGWKMQNDWEKVEATGNRVWVRKIWVGKNKEKCNKISVRKKDG